MSKNLEFGLVISADGTAAISTLDKIDTGLDKVDKTASKSGTSTGKTFDRLRQRANQTSSSLQNMGNRTGWLSSKLGSLKSSLQDSVNKTKNFGQSLTGLISKAGLLGGVFGTLGATLSLGSLVESQRQFDILNSQLITATGGTKQAAAAFDELTKFASTTPYALEQSVEGFTQLKNLGLDPSMRSMKSYGNFAAAMGKDLNQMIEAVADASTFEFERLKEFGIKSSQQKDKVSFTFQGVTTTVGKNSKEIQDYLLAIGETKFGDAMANRAKTLDGAISNLGDNFNSLKLAVVQSGIGDAIQGIVISVADGLARMTQALKEPANTQALKSAIDSVGNAFGRLQDFASLAGSAIGQVTGFFTAHQEILIPLATGIATAATAFGLFTAGVAAWTTVGTLATAVTTGFGVAIGIATSPVTLILGAITALVAGGVLLYRNWDRIKAKATEVFKSLPAPVQEAFANIKQTFSTLKQWATSAFDFLAPYVRTTMGVVSAVFTAKWSLIKGVFSTAFSAIKGIVTTNFNVIKAVLTTGISVLATVFNTGFNIVKNTVKTAFNAIKALARGDIKGFVTIIGSGLKNAAGIVRSGVGNIINAFGTLGKKLFSIGTDAVQGLINGVKSKISGAIEVARNLASSVSKTITDFFIIRSPSRLTTKQGGHISEGLAVGIKAKGKKAVQAMKDVAKKIADKVKSLQREIALFGKSDELSAFNYDVAQGLYGKNKRKINQIASLIKHKQALADNAKTTEQLRTANERVAQSLANINKQIALFGNTDKLVSLKYDIEQGGLYKGASPENVAELLSARAQLQQLEQQKKLDDIAEQEKIKVDNFASQQQSSLAKYVFETSLIGKTADEVERLRFERNLLNQAEQAGNNLSDQSKQQLAETTQSIIAQRNELIALREQQLALQAQDWVGGIKSGLQSLVDKAQTLNQTMSQATTSAFNKMSDGIANFVATGKGNFKDLTASILQDISKMLIKFAMLRLAKMAVGMFENGGAFGGSGLLAYAKGGAFNGQGIQYYANGDIFNRPTAFSHAGGLGVMGEAGPEAVMPLTRGANGKLGVQVYGSKKNSQSAGVVNQVQIDININNERASTDVQTSTQDGKQLAESLKAVVLKTLTEEMRAGGMLASR